MRTIFIIIILLNTLTIRSQTYPSFGSEIDVTVNGLSSDAMEPFISPNGNYLFFNNLNDGINTKLYYAIKLNDSTFNYVGELNGTNQTEIDINSLSSGTYYLRLEMDSQTGVKKIIKIE